MTWKPTNTDDVTLIISAVIRDDTGSRTGSTEIANTSAVVVDDFSIDTEEDLEILTGVGNAEANGQVAGGVSKGDIEHTFSFTVQGEDAFVFQNLTNDNGRAGELEIIVNAQDYKDKLVGAYAGTRNLSGSSGDPLEFEVEGVATGRNPGEVEEG